ncbi:MAG: hypothetical protein KAT79_05710 [candidate division Zixibacteria bacterium]|nr:hypothetical protein [candidate division Zixibacteria bacterium]
MKEYKSSLERTRSIAADFVKVIAIVGAVSIVTYFWDSANLQTSVSYVDHWYDIEGILSDLHEHGLDKHFKSLPRRWAKVLSTDSKFMRGHPNFGHDTLFRFQEFDEMRDGVRFKPRPWIGNLSITPPGWIINIGFWESEFTDSLESMMERGLIDSVAVYKTRKIIISRRIVLSVLSIQNSGDLAAKNIEVYLQSPFLLQPRCLISRAQPEFLTLSPDNDLLVRRGDLSLAVSIPFLRNNDNRAFHIETSLTNISDNNVFVDYESDRVLRSDRILWISLIVLLLYYGAPFFWWLFPKLREYRRRGQNRPETKG